MTVAVKQYDIKVPYGVIECEGPRVFAFKEKPQIHFLVNAGVYLLEPKVYEFITNGEHFDMNDLTVFSRFQSHSGELSNN